MRGCVRWVRMRWARDSHGGGDLGGDINEEINVVRSEQADDATDTNTIVFGMILSNSCYWMSVTSHYLDLYKLVLALL